MPAISVICPVYNSAWCLNKCIRSVYKQSFKDWELILVNDCSTDNSNKIIENWKEKDKKRIFSINHEENRGVDQARFSGLNKSIGKYIIFLDSDDWLAKDSLKKMYNKAEFEKSDIVYGSIVRVLDKFGLIKKKKSNSYTGILTKNIITPELFDDYYISYFGVNKLFVSMYGKLYNNDTIKQANLQPSFSKMGEDLVFNMRLHPFLKKISFVEDTVYYYRYGGMTSGSNPDFLKDIKQQYILKKEMIEKYEYYKAKPYINYELINCFYSYFKARILIDKIQKKEIINMMSNELKDPVYIESVKDIKLSRKHNCIKDNNVEEIYQIIQETLRLEKTRTYLKRVMSALFR